MPTWTFVKADGAPAGTINISVADGAFVIDDASNTTIVTSTPQIAGELRGVSDLKLQGVSGAVHIPVVEEVFLVDGVLSKRGPNGTTVPAIASLSAEAVRLATTGPLPGHTSSAGTLTATATGALSIDSKTVVTGDRVLVKNEVLSQYNGTYIVLVPGSGGTNWTLVRDASTLTSGTNYSVGTGPANGGSSFILTTDNPIIADTTPLTFILQQGTAAIMDLSGGTDGDLLSFDAASGKAKPKHTTKRMRIVMSASGHDTPVTSSNYNDMVQRHLVKLPGTTTRWRLCIANADAVTSTFFGGAFSFNGVAIGTPRWAAGKSQWNGDFTAAPIQALGAFTTNPPNVAAGDSTVYDYQTAWVNDPALQFQAYQLYAVSLGWTSLVGDGTHVMCSTSNGALQGLSGRANRWNQQTMNIAAPIVSSGLDIRLEYEVSVPSGQTVRYVLAAGDSITRGLIPGFEAGAYRGLSGTIHPHQSWPGVAGLRNGVHVSNLGIGGTNTLQWAGDPSTNWLWKRCIDAGVAIPDAIWCLIGSNDANGNESVVTEAQMRTNVETLISNWRTLGTQRFGFGTVIPRAQSWPDLTTGAVKEQDVVDTKGATSGTFNLQFMILGLPFTTAALNWNDSAATVAAAIQLCLPTAMQVPGTVVGTGGPLNTGTVTITWNPPAYGDIKEQAVVSSTLAGGSSAATFTQNVQGTKSAETIRVAFNEWLGQQPSGIEDVWDFSSLLADPLNPQLLRSTIADMQNVHPWLLAYLEMAGLVDFK